ncbi:hypothetical protein [Couchioplanes caeruleus]|uniref:VWFA domain-containing protein n=1 Tax=Couchioplanes caeruleus TaxID=56438 RepID=A0A3N1GF60_9ACTN|nr:hypothetical protein [Couchioplanes caeruleus]ROP28850.1 hypothetical protein EDD30_1627 [Couchioplanes caeruleus]
MDDQFPPAAAPLSAHPVAAVPADGAVEADYPYAVAKTVEQPELAARLRAAIKPAALTAAGFSTAAPARVMPVPAQAGKLLGPALQWSRYKRHFQVLLLADSSGSMHQPVTDKARRPDPAPSPSSWCSRTAATSSPGSRRPSNWPRRSHEQFHQAAPTAVAAVVAFSPALDRTWTILRRLAPREG